MAFHLGTFKNKHAPSRQQGWKVHFAEVGTLCPRYEPPAEVTPQSMASDGKAAWLGVARPRGPGWAWGRSTVPSCGVLGVSPTSAPSPVGPP